MNNIKSMETNMANRNSLEKNEVPEQSEQGKHKAQR